MSGDRRSDQGRFGIHDTFESALRSWDEYRLKLAASQITGCQNFGSVLQSLAVEFDDLNVEILVKFLCQRVQNFFTDSERQQLGNESNKGSLLCDILKNKGRGESTLKYLYLALLDSYENDPIVCESHNTLARMLIFRCSPSCSASLQGACRIDLKDGMSNWERNELCDPERIISIISEHCSPELGDDVAREFIKHLGIVEKDVPVPYTLNSICKIWYTKRESKEGAFDDLIAALMKTKFLGRLVSCARLPTCYTSSQCVLEVLNRLQKDERKCRKYLTYLGFEKEEIHRLFISGARSIYTIIQMPVCFKKDYDGTIVKESLKHADIDVREFDINQPCPLNNRSSNQLQTIINVCHSQVIICKGERCCPTLSLNEDSRQSLLLHEDDSAQVFMHNTRQHMEKCTRKDEVHEPIAQRVQGNSKLQKLSARQAELKKNIHQDFLKDPQTKLGDDKMKRAEKKNSFSFIDLFSVKGYDRNTILNTLSSKMKSKDEKKTTALMKSITGYNDYNLQLWFINSTTIIYRILHALWQRLLLLKLQGHLFTMDIHPTTLFHSSPSMTMGAAGIFQRGRETTFSGHPSPQQLHTTESFKLFWIYPKAHVHSSECGSVSCQYSFVVVMTPCSQQYDHTTVIHLEDIPERLKADVEVQSHIARFKETLAAEFHVVCNDLNFYSTATPATITVQDILDSVQNGVCPPRIVFETNSTLLGSHNIIVFVRITGLSITEIKIAAKFTEQLQETRLPMLTPRCSHHPITMEQLQAKVKPCLDTLAGCMTLQCHRNQWRTYGKMLGLKEEVLCEIGRNHSEKRIDIIHKRWIETSQFASRCIQCNAEKLYEAVTKINELSLIRIIVLLYYK